MFYYGKIVVHELGTKILNLPKIGIVERIFTCTVYPNKPMIHMVFISSAQLNSSLTRLRQLAVDEIFSRLNQMEQFLLVLHDDDLPTLHKCNTRWYSLLVYNLVL